MGSCQSQNYKQSQIARNNIINKGLKKQESNSQSTHDSNHDFLQTEDVLYQEINNMPHYQDQHDENNNLTFEIKSLFQQVQISEKQKQKVPATINVSTHSLSFKQFLGGMDIICIIDISRSMKEKKIKLLKQTLLKMLDLLEEKDRLSLIVFNDQAQLLTVLKKLTLINKQIFQKVINDITVAEGNYNIYDALEKGLTLLKQRKQLNTASTIFLFCGGEDFKTQPKIKELYQDNSILFSLVCFCLGKDHNPTLLQKISCLYNGIYYNISDIDNLGRYLLEALSHIINSKSQQIKITLGCLVNEIFEDQIEIKTIYSKKWSRIVKKKKYRLLLPINELERGQSFVFKLQIPILQNAILEQSKDIAVVFASIQIPCQITNQIFYKKTTLSLTIQPNNAPSLKFYQDQDVALKYYKLICFERMRKAQKFCKLKKFDTAKNILKKVIAKIKQDDAIAALCQALISWIQQKISVVGQVQKDFLLQSETQYIFNKQTEDELFEKIYEYILNCRQEKNNF